jgi:hypothetical protein
MDKKKFESKLRDVLKMLWELIPEVERKAPGNPLYREGAQAFENFLKNNTDTTYNEVCSAHKALEGEGLQAYDFKEQTDGLPKRTFDNFFDIFGPALRDLLSTAWKDDSECEKIIQEVLRDFESCRTLV